MGKNIYGIIGILFLCFALSTKVNAESYYTNLNGVSMSEIEYNDIITKLSETKASILTQEEFNKYKNSNKISGNTIYQKIVYNEKGIISETEISKSEYDQEANINKKVCYQNKYLNTKSSDEGYIETTYKRFNSQLVDFGNNDLELLDSLTWKKVPACRSYDVFAFRLTHMAYSNVHGIQVYFQGNSYTNISYSTDSPGYKSATNGAGFSMNLKDDNNISKFEMTLIAELYINQFNYSTAHVFSTYQHAQSDLTRAQSMSYSLQAGGLGDVIYYSNSNIRNKYDDMAGIELMTPIP